MEPIEFQPWPKIARLRREVTITEKIDGTNAAIIVADDLTVAAQARSRIITPDDDNFGFARWVADNAEPLSSLLGPGRHFGEWWGAKIQRRYGMPEKRFSLFNTARYADLDTREVPQLSVVPILYQGPFSDKAVEDALELLRIGGSVAAPGFMRPEGVVIYMSSSNSMFKVTLENDGLPKSAVA